VGLKDRHEISAANRGLLSRGIVWKRPWGYHLRQPSGEITQPLA